MFNYLILHYLILSPHHGAAMVGPISSFVMEIWMMVVMIRMIMILMMILMMILIIRMIAILLVLLLVLAFLVLASGFPSSFRLPASGFWLPGRSGPASGPVGLPASGFQSGLVWLPDSRPASGLRLSASSFRREKNGIR